MYREDEGDYYDDGDNKDYYFYDGRRKKEQYFYHQRRKRAVFTLDIAGNGQPINMIFTSDASGSASGVIAQFSVQGEGSTIFLSYFSKSKVASRKKSLKVY